MYRSDRAGRTPLTTALTTSKSFALDKSLFLIRIFLTSLNIIFSFFQIFSSYSSSIVLSFWSRSSLMISIIRIGKNPFQNLWKFQLQIPAFWCKNWVNSLGSPMGNKNISIFGMGSLICLRSVISSSWLISWNIL